MESSRILGPVGKRVQLIMLDTRFFRSDIEKLPQKKGQMKRYRPGSLTTHQLLGEQQWQWFEKELLKPAELRIIASSIQVTTAEGTHEGWYLFPNDLSRFKSLLSKLRQQGHRPIILSGDRHFSAGYGIQGALFTGEAEFTISSMNLPITGKARQRIEEHLASPQATQKVMDPNFAILEIDWETRSYQIKWKNIENRVVMESGKGRFWYPPYGER